eukprot:1530604-Pyramimonas_sp.AAC.1
MGWLWVFEEGEADSDSSCLLQRTGSLFSRREGEAEEEEEWAQTSQFRCPLAVPGRTKGTIHAARVLRGSVPPA